MSEELKKLTKAELIKKAAKRKISVTPSMLKDEIVSAIKKVEAKSVQTSGKTAKKAATAAKPVAKPAASAKPVAVKKAAKPAAKPAASAKPVAAKKAAAVKPVEKPATPAKPTAKKTPVATKQAAKPAAPVKPVATKKAVAAKPAAKPVVAAKPEAVKKPVAASRSVETLAKPVPVSVVKAAVELPAAPKVAPMKADAAQESKEVKETTRKPTAAKSKAVDAALKDKTGKRSAGAHPASPTPPLNAGKEPSLSPAVSPLSVKTLAANNGKRSWDIKIDEKKFFIADEKYDYTQHGEQPRLPERYGDMRLIALARDPFKLYIYWELDGGGVERARAKTGSDWPALTWVIRVFDVTGVEFNGANANRHFDVEVDPYLGSVYMDVDRADCEYTLVMGLRNSDGGFAPVVASNKVRTPRVEPSAQTDVEWSVPDGLFAAIYGISGGYSSSASGSLDSSKLGLPSGGVSSWGISSFQAVSSGAVSSFGASEQMVRGKQRKFFFWLDCELIVYGGTEPDAIVHMKGKKINLRPDGTFTARFFLPDGVFDIPVTAQSSDGVELREISPTATRVTRRKEEFLVSEEEWLKK